MHRYFVYENIADDLKNHWTKRRHVCTHFDAFSNADSNYEHTIKQFGNFWEQNPHKIAIVESSV